METKKENHDLILAYEEKIDELELNTPRLKVALACTAAVIEDGELKGYPQYLKDRKKSYAEIRREIKVAEKLLKLIPEWINKLKKTGDKK